MKERVFREIDLDNLIHNLSFVRSKLSEDCQLCAIVKANAYGHGIEAVRTLAKEGVKTFAVATQGEALELRDAGIDGDIIILTKSDPEDAVSLADMGFIQSVPTREYAKALEKELFSTGRKLKIHVKLDTGMNRTGFSCRTAEDIQKTVSEVEKIAELSCFELCGAYSHFAVSDKKTDIYNAIQYRNYLSVINKLKSHGVEIPVKHICNSDAIFNFPHCHMDMVRAGICLYGGEAGINLKPVMSLRCSVLQVHDMGPGECVSYGCTYKSSKPMKVATLSVGYADGLPRAWGDRGYVLIGGRRAKILGRICMDQCMADVTDIPCTEGDIATVFGTDGAETLTAKKIADALGTISYEILCGFDRKRVGIRYVKK